MSLLQRYTNPPIGVDIGTRMIKAVQLRHKHGKTSVGAYASFGRSGDDPKISTDEATRLARVLAQQGFVGRTIVLSPPAERLMSSIIDMPPRESGAPYNVIAAKEFARLQCLEPGHFEMAWWDVPKRQRSSSTKIMAIGCAYSDSEPILDTFAGAGFDVAVMDSGLCSAVKASLGMLGPANSVSALLDMGWGAARLALVHSEVVVFERVLNGCGLGSLLNQVSKVLGLELAEADALLQNVGISTGLDAPEQQDSRISAAASVLRPVISAFLDEVATELIASFEYAEHEFSDTDTHRIVLTGGGACVSGVAEYLNNSMSAEVISAQTGKLLPDQALMTAALGLAGYVGQG